MTVGDIINNTTFDFNANYAIYKCPSGICWHETEPIFSTKENKNLTDDILNLKVIYMTISDNHLIIETSDET